VAPRIVDDVVGFVLEHGRAAEELLWYEHRHGASFPDPLTDAESAALWGTLLLVREAFASILENARQRFITIAASHPWSDSVARSRPTDLRESPSFGTHVIRGRLAAGMMMEASGEEVSNEDRIFLWGWIWVREEDRFGALEAAHAVDPDVQPAPNGNLHVRLVQPATGDAYEDVGERAATRLWAIVRAVADGLLTDDPSAGAE